MEDAMNRKLWENLTSLYGVHSINYLVPLITLPYLARVLGPAEWGALAFADAYGRIVGMVVEYGFGLSATRDVARFRNEAAERSRCLASVFGGQFLLATAALFLTAVLATTLPVFIAHRLLLPSAFLLAITQGASPMWYFIALERLRLMGSLWVLGRIAGGVGLFLFVHSTRDGPRALLIQATAPALSLAVGLILAYRDTPFTWPSMRLGWRALKSGGSVFAFRAGTAFNAAMNVVLLGFVAPPLAVAWFAGAEKIARAAVMGTAPIPLAFYPRINHQLATDRPGATKTVRLSIRILLVAGASIGIVLFLAAPLLVMILLGSGFAQTVPVLRVFALLPPCVALSSALGSQWMLTLRLDRQLNRIILSSCAFSILCSLLSGRLYGAIGVAASVVLAELLVIALILAVLRRRGLEPWRPLPERDLETVPA
jgi:polysaccharide transporter, PST family